MIEGWKRPTEDSSAFFLLDAGSFCFDSVFHTIAFTFNDYGFAMMEDTVQDGGGEGGIIIEDSGPLFERFIGGNANGTVFVAFADDLEKQIGAGFINGHITEFVKHKELWFEESFEFGFDAMIVLGGQKGIDQINGGDPPDGIAFLTGVMA